MTEKSRTQIHKLDVKGRTSIHLEDNDKFDKISDALSKHKTDKSRKDNDARVDCKLDSITSLLNDWTPYIQDGMKRSEAYKYVANDLKNRSKSWKWWGGLAVLSLSIVSGLYFILERLHFIK